MPTDAQKLATSVARLNRRLRQERHSALTATQLSVLGTVRLMGPCTPSQVAHRERVSPPSVTRTIGCLVDDGLLLREPHPDDGRQVLVRLSDKGEDVLAEERARRDAWLDRRMRDLSADERALLRKATVLFERLSDSE
ncbi:MarR family winged helix-turn-helix transcriptional regulator [Aeromicrobium massiliense]|uniref:MarR family winged helix-turn-helix transcriptional regulator n=1 Tax=Aeromicrobium massiliense TaxID=1464554 RepID=UPI0002D37A7A|nr:MarR family transcriptional regulator [Aeromicrobium massiliense]